MSPPTLQTIPPEVRERIFQWVRLSEHENVSDHVRLKTGGPPTVCIPVRSVRPSKLMHVDRALRAEYLEFFFRTTTFLLRATIVPIHNNPRLLSAHFAPHGAAHAWLCSLDVRGECGIRKLRFEMSRLHAAYMRADLDVVYQAAQGKWTCEFCPETKWKPFQWKRDRAAVARPTRGEMVNFAKVFEQQTCGLQDGAVGLNWAGARDLYQVLMEWQVVEGKPYRVAADMSWKLVVDVEKGID